MTNRLYIQNVYQKEAEMTLLEVKEENGKIWARFDQSVFFPESGGQLSDRGTIGEFNVPQVDEEKDTKEVWHLLEDAKAQDLKVGNVYKGQINWEVRFRHMQMHCGEHLISGAFYKLLNASNKGFHMGDDYVTIDIDLDPQGKYKEMTPEMIKAAERLANEAIWSNQPVTTHFFDTAKEAMKLPCRKEIKFNENISVVLIGDADDPADCCACCGTHPAFAGEVGIIKITHVEKYKGMTRFYVKCGEVAYDDYVDKQDILSVLGRKYSCDYKGLEAAIDGVNEKASETYRKYAELKKYIMAMEVGNLKKAMAEPTEKSILVLEYDLLQADDLQNMLKDFEGKIAKPLALVSTKENVVVLASNGTPDCGKLVKENASIYQGKGGGKPNLSRAIFTNKENLDLYLDLIEKHLR